MDDWKPIGADEPTVWKDAFSWNKGLKNSYPKRKLFLSAKILKGAVLGSTQHLQKGMLEL